MLLRLLAGFGLSLLVGGLGYWRRSLSLSGWLGAVLIGTLTVGCGSWAWGWLIILFFASSSLLSKVGKRRKAAVALDKFSKDDRRDLWQAMANGGIPLITALGYAWQPHFAWWALALGATATATADTWATEIGTLSKGRPFMLTTFKQVERGRSGAISGLGMAATSLGALLIGLSAWGLTGLGLGNGQEPQLWFVVAATIGGIAGSLADSLLGATVQQMRWCEHCASETERAIHKCGNQTRHYRGLAWLNNDWVNLISTGAGALVALLIAVLAN
ncbi:MAG: DUF92 domain-containing protein [Chloroflexi bacterium]|nr:DUF92 domain-containing protein [Chloroflexota bacterium]